MYLAYIKMAQICCKDNTNMVNLNIPHPLNAHMVVYYKHCILKLHNFSIYDDSIVFRASKPIGFFLLKYGCYVKSCPFRIGYIVYSVVCPSQTSDHKYGSISLLDCNHKLLKGLSARLQGTVYVVQFCHAIWRVILFAFLHLRLGRGQPTEDLGQVCWIGSFFQSTDIMGCSLILDLQLSNIMYMEGDSQF